LYSSGELSWYRESTCNRYTIGEGVQSLEFDRLVTLTVEWYDGLTGEKQRCRHARRKDRCEEESVELVVIDWLVNEVRKNTKKTKSKRETTSKQ